MFRPFAFAVLAAVVCTANPAFAQDRRVPSSAAELRLSAEERKRLDDVSLPQLLYPYWHQRNTASDRLGEADLSLLGPHLNQ